MELSRRTDRFNRKLDVIMGNPDHLSASGRAVAVAATECSASLTGLSPE